MINIIQIVDGLRNGQRYPISVDSRHLESKEAFNSYKATQQRRFDPEEFVGRGKMIHSSHGERVGISKEENLKRVEEWANANEKLGKKAAINGFLSVVFGIVIAFLENIGHGCLALNKLCGFIYGVTLGGRGREQYIIHARKDDELGINTYQAKQYGNIMSKVLGKIACFTEKYINPVVLPFIGLLSGAKRSILNYLFMLPKLEWWRGRYAGYFDQRFLTYLFKFIANKALVLLGSEESKMAIDEIKESKVLSLDYLKEGLKANYGLKEGESVIKKTGDYISDLISGDTDKIGSAAKHINETIAPILGTSGFFLTGIGVPVKGIVELACLEVGEKTERLVDVFSSAGIATQQFLYFFRFSIPEYVESKRMVKDIAEDKEIPPELKCKQIELAKDKFNLFLTGVLSNAAGILLPFAKLIKSDGLCSKIIKSVSCELSNTLVGLFLSWRRMLNGRKAKYEIIKEKIKMGLLNQSSVGL